MALRPQQHTITPHTLRNASGTEAEVLDYGGIIKSLRVPDREGRLENVVLGFETAEDYLGEHPYLGAIIGRYANRIADGRFKLDGRTYHLPTNDGPNHLHGGNAGFDKVMWEATRLDRPGARSLALRYRSPAGEEGYPGTVIATVTYTLTDRDELICDYHAVTDEATPINLTHHSYFNLAGPGSGDILDHRVTIQATRFTPVNATLIPTGELRPVAGTPFDFGEPTSISARIGEDDEQLRFGGGYDHNFVLRADGPAAEPALAARVEEPTTGRVMEVLTTEPGLQFYSGNSLDVSGRERGFSYGPRSGFAMETQHFPDSPNQPTFPSTILRPGEEYTSRTIYRFTTTEGR